MNKKTTLAVLIEVAEELNKKLGLKPAIPVDGTKDAIFDEIKLNAGEIVPADKKLLSEKTWSFFESEKLLDHLPKEEKKSEVKEEKKPTKKVEAKTEVKKETAEKPVKPAATPKPPRAVKSSETAERNALLKSLIEKNKFTKAELLEKLREAFPNRNKSTLLVMVTDVKNPKYSPFKPMVAVVDEKGVYSFPEK